MNLKTKNKKYKRNKKNRWYSLDNILSCNAPYNIIFGQRSNGKSYSVLKYAIEKYVETGDQCAYIRRWDTDVVASQLKTTFDPLVVNGEIQKITDGHFTNVTYKNRNWYLSYYKDDDLVLDNKPFATAFSINSTEHYKSSSYPNHNVVIFEEFITNRVYLINEFVLFMNLLSTIVRKRKNVKIFMIGNTVDKNCPYFKDMGLKKAATMEQGTIDVYMYGDTGLSVAVERCYDMSRDFDDSELNNDFLFAFDNPKLKMITNGAWEIGIYPHITIKYKPKDILYTYFIILDEERILQCEIVNKDDDIFTCIHRKTSELQYRNDDLIYDKNYNMSRNFRRNLLKPNDKLSRFIVEQFRQSKIMYQDNEVGDDVDSYIKWCRQN